MKYNDFKHHIKGLPLFSTSMLHALTHDVPTLKVQLSMWKKKGFIQSLRQGLYVLNAEERQIEPPLFYLANQMFSPSYVSLESALAHYGLIPEYVAQMTSVTARKTSRFENALGVFTYQHVLREGYGGIQSIRQDGFTVLIATAEKAVIDFLYLNLVRFDPLDRKIFRQSYRFQNCERLNPSSLNRYAQKFGSKKLISIAHLFIKELIR